MKYRKSITCPKSAIWALKLAITQIVLGAMVITILVCPSPRSKAVLGAAVLGVGIAQFIRARK